MADTTAAETWVFAYGSLMWQPGFPFTAAFHARLDGHHRAFCVYSVHYRGTPSRPGLVLGLERGGTCEGLAFRLAPSKAADTLAYLHRRELIYGVYREAALPVTLATAGRPRIAAVTYLAERAHPAHSGPLPLSVQASIIRSAAGVGGTNLDYLINTVEQLERIGIHDRDLTRLLALAGGVFCGRGSGHAPNRASSQSLMRAWKNKRARTPRLKKAKHFAYRARLD